MTRQIFIYILVFGTVLFLGEYTHSYYIESKEITLGFSLKSMYAFHAFFSLQLCIIFTLLATNQKISPQLGFIYLASFILKIIIFCAIFYNPIFMVEKLSKTQRVSLVIPMALFLILEVYFIIKILHKKHSLK